MTPSQGRQAPSARGGDPQVRCLDRQREGELPPRKDHGNGRVPPGARTSPAGTRFAPLSREVCRGRRWCRPVVCALAAAAHLARLPRQHLCPHLAALSGAGARSALLHSCQTGAAGTRRSTREPQVTKRCTHRHRHTHTHVHAPRSRCGRPAPPAAQVTVSQTRPALPAHRGSALSSANAPEIQPSTMQNAPVHVLKLLRNVFFPKEILRQTSVWQTEEGGPCGCRAGREVPGRPSSSVRQGARPARHPSPPGRRGHLASV